MYLSDLILLVLVVGYFVYAFIKKKRKGKEKNADAVIETVENKDYVEHLQVFGFDVKAGVNTSLTADGITNEVSPYVESIARQGYKVRFSVNAVGDKLFIMIWW